MRRSGPPKRRKQLRAKKGLKRRKGLRPFSKKRKATWRSREQIRLEVIDRDRGCVADGIEGVPHGQIPGRAPLEVHELKRGASRSEVFLDPEWCIALCPQAHDWATVQGYPEPAISKGLCLPSHAENPGEARRRRLEFGARA